MKTPRIWTSARDRYLHVLSGLILVVLTGCGGDGGGGKRESPVETPLMSVSRVEVDEGDSGTTAAVFRLSLSNPASEPVIAMWSTLDGTASEGEDYRSTSGKLVIEPGTMDTTVVVNVVGDREVERDETFFLVLENLTGADLVEGAARTRGTVLDDDEENDTEISDRKDDDRKDRGSKKKRKDDDGGRDSSREST